MVSSITQGADTETLAYDPDHNRGSLSDSSSGDTTWYFSNPAAGAMSELLQGSTDSWRDYMMAYGHIVAERFDTAGTPSVYYFVGDHLASTTTLTDASQNQKEYDAGACPPAAPCADRGDAWGKRRNANGSDIANCNYLLHPESVTLRGFTAQEEMDSYCLVNLNGRIYDPALGRMLSADPTVPDPMDGQSYNRYSYVRNNPLAFADPSGFDGDNAGGGTPCWYCVGTGLTSDVNGDVTLASNFSGGWDDSTTGWNGTYYTVSFGSAIIGSPAPQANTGDTGNTGDPDSQPGGGNAAPGENGYDPIVDVYYPPAQVSLGPDGQQSETITITAPQPIYGLQSDAQLLAQVLFSEAAAYPSAFIPIGWTALNRIGAPGFPKTLRGVIFQKNAYGVGTKLWNLASNPSSLTDGNAASYAQALSDANGIIDGSIPDPTSGAQFFYSSSNGQPPPNSNWWAVNISILIQTYQSPPYYFFTRR